ncbi:FAD-dependent oxidoreductase [Nonomuraea sp. NPDC049725]|uniref:FAD-dependent oxidoreductase n=1 Tax=Nonomuraea sp. NPDC049725 TaxID=3154508 RepID=UPI0034416971
MSDFTGPSISRRDFFDGVAVTAGAAVLASPDAALAAGGPADLTGPAGLTGLTGPAGGLRGDTAQALSVPHALRDGRFWQYADPGAPTGEEYDLVVVGGGVSGVSAAYAWLRREPGARVLVLDNHDELGGHTRGEELRPGGWPGAVIRTPEARALVEELGVPAESTGTTVRTRAYDSVMCDRESFGSDVLVGQDGDVEAWAGRLPIAGQARRDLVRLHRDPPDWFPGLSQEEKEERLAGLTYSAFLLEVCRAHPDVERFCRTMSSAAWGYGTRAFGAIDAWASAYPGFGGLGLDRGKPSRFNSPTVKQEWERPAYRLTGGVRSLVARMAGRMPGARFRLSSPVVSVRDNGAGVVVGYFDGHAVRTVRAGAAILACWHMVIPYLVPDLPDEQRAALRQAVKMPLVEAVVRLRRPQEWRGRARWTGAYWTATEVDGTRAHLVAAPCRSELGPAEGAAAGRRELFRTSYAALEQGVRDQLGRLLGSGFDPAGDVEAITVYRWGHGFAPEYCRPWHPFHPDGPSPAETARRRFGRIAIAGSDAVPGARADAAISAAHRAVTELLAG